MPGIHKRRGFSTTRWRVVRAAGNTESARHASALEELCSQYWYPLYAFVRRQGYREQESEDLIQEFFSRLVERDYLASVEQGKGRFRTFLLVCLKRFLVDQRRHDRAQKRGGRRTLPDINRAELLFGLEAVHQLSSEEHYERRWALALLENVIKQLAVEMKEEGKEAILDQLLPHLVQEQTSRTQAAIANSLGMTPGAVRMESMRLRKRFGVRMRQEIRQTVASAEDVEDEIRHIFDILSR